MFNKSSPKSLILAPSMIELLCRGEEARGKGVAQYPLFLCQLLTDYLAKALRATE